MTDTSPLPGDAAAVARVLGRALALGFAGFGGGSGEAAVAINRVLFAGRGTLVGALNEAFLDRGHMIGHVAVRALGPIWDGDACAKSFDDIEHWGMLDLEDEDYQDAARRVGFTLERAREPERPLMRCRAASP
jgi:hypothetical protein